MRRSTYRRESKYARWFNGKRRILAAVATLVAFGGIVTVTQVSDASTKRSQQSALAACDRVQAPGSVALSTKTRKGTYTTNGGAVTQHADDGAGSVPSQATMRQRCRDWVLRNTSASTTAGRGRGGQQGNNGGGQQANNGGQQQGNNGGQQQGNNGGNNNGGNNNGGNNGGNNNPPPPPPPPGNNNPPPPGNGLGVLANSCEDSDLQPHDGFQNGNRCVTTEFGEVASEGNNSTLLITEAPRQVNVNQAFALRVSTRNLIRDRFLAAGQGGYYVESSLLRDGIVRGHFHTACRVLDNTNSAPQPAPVPEFFVATEDQQGGRGADTVTINVPGLPRSGTAQCSSWAGDGSHRVPMMQRANQTPAFDSVRIEVRGGGGGGNNGNNNNGNNNNRNNN